MTAPTSITVEVDKTEYSRFEEERKDILVTISAVGSSLTNEEILVELIKARFNRDEVVASKTVSLISLNDQTIQTTFDIAAITDATGIPVVRRGDYFVRATSVTDEDVSDETENFKVALISVDRLKADYLHGADGFSFTQLQVVEQPQKITGVTIEYISPSHALSSYSLAYNFVVSSPASFTGTGTQNFTLANNDTLIIIVDGTSYTATFNTADFADITNATGAEVIAVINADIPLVTASVVSNAIKITGNAADSVVSLVVDPSGTATAELGFTGLSSTATVVRTLSWCGGPQVVIEPSKKVYTLQVGGGGRSSSNVDYIKARVSSVAQLPRESHAELLILDHKPLDDNRTRAFIEQAITWVEEVAIGVYLEPTRVVTELNHEEITYEDGSNIPTFVGATWDKVVDAIEYTMPAAGHWLGFKCPYYPILKFNSLYGKLSNVRIIDVQLSWIEAHEVTGWVELVPFNQTTAFNYIGLVWVESLRGPVPLPNFWNFDAIVGFRKTPAILLELAAKKAAMDYLTVAGQAFRGGTAAQAISRDGVSESVSYTASAMYGIYSASIQDYNKWIRDNVKDIKDAYRGVNLIVL